MQSYDREKMIRLLERKRADYMTLRDFSDRAREAREALIRHQNHMRHAAQAKGASNVLDGLFRVPLASVGTLARKQVEAYEIARGETIYSYTTGVSWSEWQQYIALRTKAERLVAEEKKHQDNVHRHFAIVQPLLDAVKGWGFNNPELEV